MIAGFEDLGNLLIRYEDPPDIADEHGWNTRDYLKSKEHPEVIPGTSSEVSPGDLKFGPGEKLEFRRPSAWSSLHISQKLITDGLDISF